MSSSGGPDVKLKALRSKVAGKRGVGEAQVARLIREKRRKSYLSERAATFAVAEDNGVPFDRYASNEDLAELRNWKQQGGALAVASAAAATDNGIAARSRRAPFRPVRRSEPAKRTPRQKTRPRSVLVVHGRDDEVRKDLFNYLRHLDLLPIEWVRAIKDTGKGNPLIKDILDALFNDATAVVVLLTPDDNVVLAPHLRGPHEKASETDVQGQARPNVFIEAGMALARFGDEHTVIVQVGDVKVPSDFSGHHITHLSNQAKKRQELMTKLINAGCDVDRDGDAWLNEGDFERKDRYGVTKPNPV